MFFAVAVLTLNLMAREKSGMDKKVRVLKLRKNF